MRSWRSESLRSLVEEESNVERLGQRSTKFKEFTTLRIKGDSTPVEVRRPLGDQLRVEGLTVLHWLGMGVFSCGEAKVIPVASDRIADTGREARLRWSVNASCSDSHGGGLVGAVRADLRCSLFVTVTACNDAEKQNEE